MSACLIFRYIYKEENHWFENSFLATWHYIYVLIHFPVGLSSKRFEGLHILVLLRKKCFGAEFGYFNLLIYPWTILDAQSVFSQSPFSAASIKIPVHGSLMASLCQGRLRDVTSFWASFSITYQHELINSAALLCICWKSIFEIVNNAATRWFPARQTNSTIN